MRRNAIQLALGSILVISFTALGQEGKSQEAVMQVLSPSSWWANQERKLTTFAGPTVGEKRKTDNLLNGVPKFQYTSAQQMQLTDYKKYFDLSYDQFIAQNNIHSSQIDENVRYEKITRVNRVALSDGHFFIFQDGKLRMIYISDDVLTKRLWSEFKSTIDVNVPEKSVRSRAGKTSNQEIFARHGITVSITGDDVDFIELYPSCSLEDYLENIYREPQPFIR